MGISRLNALLRPGGEFGSYKWQINSWSQLERGASFVRNAVFVDEQGVPAELEYDEHDLAAVHILMTTKEGEPLATARLVKKGQGVSVLGRMCVLLEHRGEGVARFMLLELMRFARRRHDVVLMLHAQSHAVSFYKKLGFRVEGKPFLEANIAHVKMVTDVTKNEFALSKSNAVEFAV
ncbi:MAG: GNAT family N-acetyltransferase [Saezia sp.]